MDKLLLSDWLQLVTALGVLVAMVGTIRSMTKSTQQQSGEATKSMTEMRVDIKHIREKVDKMGNVPERLTAVEESTKQAHRRIDEHNTRIGRLEDKSK